FISPKPHRAYAVSAFDAFRRESIPAQWNEMLGIRSLVVDKNNYKLRLNEKNGNYDEIILYKDGITDIYRCKYATELQLPALPEGCYILVLKPFEGKEKRYVLTIE
ncbi:MAG: hypothetical protein IJ338_05830, partial [Bacteroidaceae bacterium]|nr:hypothetical protein [Bacteroidaceae bacterium]